MINKKGLLFKNREDAALQLIDVLPIDMMRLEEWNVIATSPNSIEIATNVAEKIGAKLDYLHSSKVLAPENKECEVAIVTEIEEVVIHEELIKAFDIDLKYVYAKAQENYNLEVKPFLKEFKDNKKLDNLDGKNVLLVDEGLNTGLTMMACIKTAITLGAKSVSVAVPVVPDITVNDIESIADDLYYVYHPSHFINISFYYDEFEDKTINEVRKIYK